MTTTSKLFLVLGLLGAIATPITAWGADKAPVPSASKGDGKEHVATCRDGAEYWSSSTSHRGACSNHGGVAEWADGSPVKSRAHKGEYR